MQCFFCVRLAVEIYRFSGQSLKGDKITITEGAASPPFPNNTYTRTIMAFQLRQQHVDIALIGLVTGFEDGFAFVKEKDLKDHKQTASWKSDVYSYKL